MIVDENEGTFEAEILRSPVPVIAYFYLPNCGKCMVWTSLVEGLEKEQGGQLKLVKLNITLNQGLAKTLKVLSTPAILIFQEGQELRRFVGEELNFDDVEHFIEDLA
jgi:thioredoxin 1